MLPDCTRSSASKAFARRAGDGPSGEPSSISSHFLPGKKRCQMATRLTARSSLCRRRHSSRIHSALSSAALPWFCSTPSGIDMYLVGRCRVLSGLDSGRDPLSPSRSIWPVWPPWCCLLARRRPRLRHQTCRCIVQRSLTSRLPIAAQAHIQQPVMDALSGSSAPAAAAFLLSAIRWTTSSPRQGTVVINGITCIIPVLAPVLITRICTEISWQACST